MSKQIALILLCLAFLLSSCSLVEYQPLETIDHVDLNYGYRSKNHVLNAHGDQNMIFLLFSGGGSRAAALGYAVLEIFNDQKISPTESGNTLLDNIDVVSGVSGGSVLAAYFSLHGKETIPKFEEEFLKRNFQDELIDQIFSFSNLPRLLSPQYGRGDLLQERLNKALFKNATFDDLVHKRKGPFALISATDMTYGNKLLFTQEYFDTMCLDLNKLEIARAVAASSSVPLVFSPLTLNNNGGNCGYKFPPIFYDERRELLRKYNLKDVKDQVKSYQNTIMKPYIHLVDGGLTDNLGLTNILDIYDALGRERLSDLIKGYQKLKRIIVINVNAQNSVYSDADLSADVPRTAAIVNSIINVPIDQNSRTSLTRFRHMVDEWNTYMDQQLQGNKVHMYFVSLNLRDLPDSPLKYDVLNISTSFYLKRKEVDQLKEAARILLQNSKEYQEVIEELQEL